MGIWINMWRSIVLSSIGKTVFPYCRFVRHLDLDDLQQFLINATFHESCSTPLFANDMSVFCIKEDQVSPDNVSTESIDTQAVFHAIVDVLVPSSPLVEVVSGIQSPDDFPRWGHWWPRLQRLIINWNNPLNGIGGVLKTHCPKFKAVQCANEYCRGEDITDKEVALFLHELPRQLAAFEGPGPTMGLKSVRALALHSSTLTELTLQSLPYHVLTKLGPLRTLTALTSLRLGGRAGRLYQPDALVPITDWLMLCTQMKELCLDNVNDAYDVLTPVLFRAPFQLRRLEVDHFRDPSLSLDEEDGFYASLHRQRTIEHFFTRMEAHHASRLPPVLASFHHLRYLRIGGSLHYWDWQCYKTVFDPPLEHLEELYLEFSSELEAYDQESSGLDDKVLLLLAAHPRLRCLQLVYWARFSLQGVLDLLIILGDDIVGIHFSIELASQLTKWKPEDVATLRRKLGAPEPLYDQDLLLEGYLV